MQELKEKENIPLAPGSSYCFGGREGGIQIMRGMNTSYVTGIINEEMTASYSGIFNYHLPGNRSLFEASVAKERCMDSFPISLVFILSVMQVEQRGMFKSQASYNRGLWGQCFLLHHSMFCLWHEKRVLEFLWFDLLSIDQKSENKRGFPKIHIFTFLESRYGAIHKAGLCA